MEYTSNYNLRKPEGYDTININDLNGNFDILDNELNKNHTTLVDLTEKTNDYIKYKDMIGHKFETFDSINNFKKDTIVITEGYYTIGDGGSAKYLITDIEKDWSIPLSNNLFANIIETEYVNYRMFGAMLNGIDNDLPFLLKAHSYGNTNKVLVKNNFGKIYKDSHDVIVIKYDVDLRGSEILITNENFYSWYEIRNDNEILYTYTNRINKSELRKDTSYFTMDDNSLPRNTVLHLKDANKWAIRYDNDLVYDEFRSELMFHNIEGLCFGALIHGYDGDDTDLSIQYSMYNNKQLVFNGCLVNIETTPNVNNGFIVNRRHNVKICDFVFNPRQNSLANNSFKGSLITIRDSYNVELNNITGNNIAGKPTSSGITSSGYVIRIMTSFKINMYNCNLNGYWGATASTCVKEWTIRDCSLNRVDVHNYFRDITVDNCKIYDWGINLGYGTGLITVRNTVFINYKRPDTGGRTLLNLNNTYGHVFSGTLHLSNIYMIKEDFDTTLVKLVYIPGYNNPRTKLKLPNIIANDIEIIDNEPSNSKFHIYKKVGETDNQFELADYIILNNIKFNRYDGSKGVINFITDYTNKDMYNSNVETDVRIENVEFINDDILSNILNPPKSKKINLNNKYYMNIHSSQLIE